MTNVSWVMTARTIAATLLVDTSAPVGKVTKLGTITRLVQVITQAFSKLSKRPHTREHILAVSLFRCLHKAGI